MVYTPQRGFAQFQYLDQQATAIAGMLANASDINLVDSAFVGPVDATVGLTAGIGVMVNPTVRSNRPGLNYDIVMPPNSAATDESFAGIVVRNQFMRTNSNGEACYFFEDMANYARRDRAGARIWVQLAQGSTVFGGPVYWIVRDTKNAGLKIGAFSAAPITGTATPTPGSLNGGTLSVNDVKAVTNGGFDIIVANALYRVAALDFSSVNTVSDVATILQAAITTASVPVTVKAVGNGVVLTTTTTGASATIMFASAPTTSDTTDASAILGLTSAAGATDASAILGLTSAAGATVTAGSAGTSEDTVLLTGARFLGTFTAGEAPCNNIALVELL